MKHLLLLVLVFLAVPCAAQMFPYNGPGGGAPRHVAAFTCTAPATHCVDIKWVNPVTPDSNAVYRSTVSGGPYTNVSGTLSARGEWIDNNVVAGATYYYVVTATLGGVESAYSTQASVTVPTP